MDKYSKVLLKVVTKENINEEDGVILREKFNKCLQKASENRIEFFFLKTIKETDPGLFSELNLSGIYQYGKEKIINFNKAISLFQKELDNKNYAIFKTYYPFPAITSDIDILFFEKTEHDYFVKKMESRGFLYRKDDNLKGSLSKSEFMKCEPHLDISWYGMRFISKDFIGKNLIKKRIGLFDFFVPNDKAAFLISAAHVLFDCQYLSLRDYLALEKIVEDKIAIQDCLREAEKFGWKNGCEYFLDTLHIIKRQVVDETGNKNVSFPFWIPVFKECIFFGSKLFFDLLKRRENHFSVSSVLFPFIYYFWKKLRSNFSRRIYRNSWLY